MAIIHDEHCHVVEQKKTGDPGTKKNGKGNDAGSRNSKHKAGESSHGGASNKPSERDRTKSGHGRSSESTGTAVGPRAAALPQHEEVCGQKTLLVRLSTHWKGRRYCPVV
jgi:hypothetical protein